MTQETNVRFTRSQQGQAKLCTVTASPGAGQDMASFLGRSKRAQGPTTQVPFPWPGGSKRSNQGNADIKSVLGLFSSGNSEFHYSNWKTAFEGKLSHEPHILLFPWPSGHASLSPLHHPCLCRTDTAQSRRTFFIKAALHKHGSKCIKKRQITIVKKKKEEKSRWSFVLSQRKVIT